MYMKYDGWGAWYYDCGDQKQYDVVASNPSHVAQSVLKWFPCIFHFSTYPYIPFLIQILKHHPLLSLCPFLLRDTVPYEFFFNNPNILFFKSLFIDYSYKNHPN